MANLDKDGNPIPINKPEKKARKPKPTSGKMGAQPSIDPGPKPEGFDRKKQNNINRNFGKSVERKVAQLVGGTRVPGSGAIKGSVHNLEGDVGVRSRDNKKVLVLIEVKGQTPRGEKVFQIKQSVLKQAKEEAELQHAFPVVWYHLKGQEHSEDWCMMPMEAVLQLIEGLKDAYDIEYKKEVDKDV